jgi:hypothetical protein
MGRTDKPFIKFDVNALPVLPDPVVLEEHRVEVVREFLAGCDWGGPTAEQVLAFAEAYADTREERFVKCLEAITQLRPDGSVMYSQLSMYDFAKTELDYYKEQKQNAS